MRYSCLNDRDPFLVDLTRSTLTDVRRGSYVTHDRHVRLSLLDIFKPVYPVKKSQKYLLQYLLQYSSMTSRNNEPPPRYNNRAPSMMSLANMVNEVDRAAQLHPLNLTIHPHTNVELTLLRDKLMRLRSQIRNHNNYYILLNKFINPYKVKRNFNSLDPVHKEYFREVLAPSTMYKMEDHVGPLFSIKSMRKRSENAAQRLTDKRREAVKTIARHKAVAQFMGDPKMSFMIRRMKRDMAAEGVNMNGAPLRSFKDFR